MTVLGEVEQSRAPWRERQFWSGSVIRNIVAIGAKMAQSRHCPLRQAPTRWLLRYSTDITTKHYDAVHRIGSWKWAHAC
jgi:hypothetical protein